MAKKKELQNMEINKTKPAISTNWEGKASYHTKFTTSTSYGEVSDESTNAPVKRNEVQHMEVDLPKHNKL